MANKPVDVFVTAPFPRVIRVCKIKSGAAADQAVATALYDYLLEPFSSETKARQFWEDTITQFFYIEASDTADTLAQLCQPLRRRIADSLNYPEHSFPLLPPFEISLSMLGDDGAGVYLLRHKDNGLIAAMQDGLA